MTVQPHLMSAVKHVPSEDRKPAVKFRVHICAICLSGAIFYVLLHYHIGDEIMASFGPLVPNAFQEVIDLIKRL